jgi:LPXTG-motif cell wall-anchored protein
LGITPSTVTFADTVVGTTSAGMDVTITNLSADSQTLTVAGGDPLDGTHFSGAQNCDGATLAPGASCAFTYTFHPTSVGPHSTTTTISITTEAASAAARAGRSMGVRALAVPAETVESGIITLSGTGIETTTTTTTTGTSTTTTTTLPATGTDLTFPLGLALFMLLLGSAFVAVVRRNGR